MTYSKLVIIKSLIWKLLEKCSVQGVAFIVTVVLARLLSPEEYGIVAIVTIFLSFSNILIEAGFSTALIQKKGFNNIDFSTIFYFSLFVAIIIYTLLFIFSGTIATFFQEPQLTVIIKVLGVNVFFCAVNSIQKAYVSKSMLFKKMFYSSFIAATFSGGIAILLAYFGMGVWALVFYSILSQLLITSIMWMTIKWRPVLVFSVESFSLLFDFGWKILATQIIISLFINARNIIISKFFSAEMLAYFDKGKQLPTLIMDNINTSIQTILFPVFSESQDDKLRVKNMVRRSIKTNCFFIFPLMIGLLVTAETLVTVVYTEKWLFMVPFVKIFAISFMLMPMQLANMEAVKSLGYSDITLKLEIIKKLFDVSILVISVFIGVLAIAWGVVLYNFICLFINLYPNIKLLKYSCKEQLQDFLPQLLLAIIMGICIYFIAYIPMSNILILFLQFVVGVLIYILLCKFFELECYAYICNFKR